MKHRSTYRTKTQLREEVAFLTSQLNARQRDLSQAHYELDGSQTEVKRLTKAVVDSVFLLEELKKQVAQQHVLLSNKAQDASEAATNAKQLQARGIELQNEVYRLRGELIKAENNQPSLFDRIFGKT